MPMRPLFEIVMAVVAPLLPTLKYMLAPVAPLPLVVCSVKVSVVPVPPIKIWPPLLPASRPYCVKVSVTMVVQPGTPEPLVKRTELLTVDNPPTVLLAEEYNIWLMVVEAGYVAVDQAGVAFDPESNT